MTTIDNNTTQYTLKQQHSIEEFHNFFTTNIHTSTNVCNTTHIGGPKEHIFILLLLDTFKTTNSPNINYHH